MKSEILVKSTAKLDEEVQDEIQDTDKDMSEIIDAELQRTGVSGCNTPDNGENQEEV